MDTPSKYHPASISFFKRNELDYILIAFLAGAIYIISIYSFGLGITNDSINYLSAAQSLPNTLTKADGTPFTEWPPLFPILLSIGKSFHLNLLLFAALLNGIAYVLLHVTLIYLFQKNLTVKSLYAFSVVLLLFSAPLLQMHVMLWSEPFFILLVLINLILLHHFYQKKHIVHLILLIAVGMLMYLQRKTGIIFITSTAVLLALNPSTVKRKIAQCSLYLFACALPVFAWYTYRFTITGKIFGAAEFQPSTIESNFEEFFSTFTSYLFPSMLPLFIRVIMLLSLLFLLGWAIHKNLYFKKTLWSNFYFKNGIFFTLLYYASLLSMLVYIQIDDFIDDRILSPVYPLLLLSALIILNTLTLSFSSRLLLPFLWVWISYPAGRTLFHIHRWNTSGTGGYNSTHWSENSLILNCIKDRNKDTLYTNSIYPLKYFLNFKLEKPTVVLQEQSELMESRNGKVICFSEAWIYPKEPCFIDQRKNKTLVVKNEHGEIWQLKHP